MNEKAAPKKRSLPGWLEFAAADGAAYATDPRFFDTEVMDNGGIRYIPPSYALPKHKGKPLFEAFWTAYEEVERDRHEPMPSWAFPDEPFHSDAAPGL